MPTNTYVALATQTVGTAVASVTFSSIPQGYTDLILVANAGTSTIGPFSYQVGNGTVDTGSNYSRTCMYADGTSAASFRETNQTYFNTANGATTIIANDIVQFMNYSNTTTNKTILDRNNNSTGTVQANVYLWRSTAAINTIKIFNASGYNLITGSTFTLYGVAAASVGAKATGGTIYSDANYFYHVFTANGTFTPSQALSADLLVVAGGGGGGYQGGGGGAGGCAGYSSQSLTATGYSITVGAGGASAIGGSANGSDSQFAALTAAVGGGRGGNGAVTNSGGNGGSGGGAGLGGSASGGTGVSGQGYAGGANQTLGNYPGGGGGGAGAVGVTPATNTSPAGNGGVGTSTYSSWGAATGFGQNVSGTYYFAGGGGSAVFYGTDWGIGGYGGGGTGTNQAGTATSGTANTGGGGGGTGLPNAGFAGNGGSGVVIVRYAK